MQPEPYSGRVAVKYGQCSFSPRTSGSVQQHKAKVQKTTTTYSTWGEPVLATAAFDASHLSTFYHECRKRTSISTFSGDNVVRSFVTTLPPQESRCSGSACVAGMASTRQGRLAKIGNSALFTLHHLRGRGTPYRLPVALFPLFVHLHAGACLKGLHFVCTESRIRLVVELSVSPPT